MTKRLTRRVRWEIVEGLDGLFTVKKNGQDTKDFGTVARAQAWIRQQFGDGDSVVLVFPNGASRIITRTIRD